LYEQYLSTLADIFFPQRCVGCDRRASDLLRTDCFEALPTVGRPACARRCGTPTAFETFVCDACKGSGLRLRERPRAAEARGSRLRRRSLRPCRARAAAPLAAQAPRVQPGGGPRAGRRGGAGRTRFGYTGGGAQDAGPGRAHDWRAADERRGSLRGLGTRARQGSPSRRPLHHRRDDELVRRDPPARRGPGGARGEPLQHGMRRAGQLVSTPLAERRRTWR
jgi:double zinc ribbon protein